ncbi:SDR family oxidoreductase [Protaetiibacter intestinalis]|uniref:SDR family oxidoreductase n=1 Tax=Protaetiibacter intestinalis TaxID=2419774 RepID=A0A387B883_9MICO|nr:SDR family oxidoreductase [Protaetiibacter intestinalis]AYF97306.1 SDR family oxidoreductase [Protaetiibacter intestinalis]
MGILDDFRLDGRLALVTGASRGIGAAIAVALAEAGADVVGVSRTMTPDGGDTGAAVRAAGREFTGIAAELSDARGVEALLLELATLDRPVDILVNNAGIAERNPAESHGDAQWEAVLAVNLHAPFLLARELGRGMLERGHGRILFLSSMNAFQGGRNVVGYAASKAGVGGIVRALANEWSDRGVTVNAIAPGYVETELTLGADGDPERIAALTPRIPVGRWARPRDLAGAAVFLASDASAYVTGVTLPVDGGWLVR